MNNKKSIVIGHPIMGRGGSEAVLMWLIQSLSSEFNITLMTTRFFDLEDLNKCYGTNLNKDDFKVLIAPIPFFMRSNSKFSALRYSFYQRFAKKVGHLYDCRISSYNLTDWGSPGIHFIGDFTWDTELSSNLNGKLAKDRPWFLRKNLARGIYLKICKVISQGARNPISLIQSEQEIIIANSNWASNVIYEKFSVKCHTTIYPPVEKINDIDAKDNKSIKRFVSVGRIATEKRIEDQINIIKRVRSKGHNIELHIIGSVGSDSYGLSIKSICKDLPWVTLHGALFSKDKKIFLFESDYAIHTRLNEPFGITVAEFIEAGCMPFVPDSGGQIEIVTPKELQFSSLDDAANKITFVLENSELKNNLQEELAKLKNRFSTRNFCMKSYSVISDLIKDKSS